MVTNNAINLKSAGLAVYDGAGGFTALTSPLSVSHGGTGNSSLTAYGVLTAGTTTTNPWQSISPGNSGEVFTSNGSSTQPSFQGFGGFTAFMCTGVAATVSDNFNFGLTYSATWNASGRSQLATQVIYIPCNCTLTSAYGAISVAGTLASTETCTIRMYVNNSSSTVLTSTVQCSSATNTWSNTSLSTALVPGDYIELAFTTATFATNPTNLSMNITLVFT